MRQSRVICVMLRKEDSCACQTGGGICVTKRRCSSEAEARLRKASPGQIEAGRKLAGPQSNKETQREIESRSNR